ncbi:MAG: glycosyltransferase family 4 protein [Cyclobacteriaceae bacterium]|nr:glycosyltransferase family 4 protein [Cyclobacteriaceae bacterium]
MKILMIHQHYRTPAMSGAIRSWYIAKAMAARGHHVVVLTGGTSLQGPPDPGIEVHCLDVPYGNHFSFWRRIQSFTGFLWKALRTAAKHRDAQLAYVISTPLTTGLVGMYLKRRFGIPFYFEVGDLWPEAPIQLGFIRNKWIKHLLYTLERTVYRNAAIVVALSPAIAQYVAQHANRKNIITIPNMSDCAFYMPGPRDAALEAHYGLKDRLVVSYIGALGYANGLEYLLQCAQLAQAQNLEIEFLICGEGAMERELRDSAKKQGLVNIHFTGFLNRDEVAGIMRITDIHFICYRPHPVLETGSPNKLFDGLAAGKVIGLNFGGWIKDLVTQHACGFAANPADPNSFIAAIQPFLDPTLRQQAGKNARALAEKEFDREILMARLLDAIETTHP